MTATTSTTKTFDGGVLAYAEISSGSGPLVVFCHATGFCKEVWQPVVESLGEQNHGWTARLVDQRHHGESQGFGADFDWWNIGRDLLDVVGNERPVVGVGHSGGGAAVVLAELLQPGTFDAAVLIEPIIFPPPYRVADDHPLADMARKRRAEFESRGAALEAYRGRGPFAGWQDAVLEGYVRGGFEEHPDGSVTLRTSRGAEAGFFSHAFAHGAWDRLGEFDVPTAILAGEFSDTHHAAFLDSQAARFASATAEIVPGASHFVPMEMPGLIADRVAAAVDSVA